MCTRNIGPKLISRMGIYVTESKSYIARFPKIKKKKTQKFQTVRPSGAIRFKPSTSRLPVSGAGPFSLRWRLSLGKCPVLSRILDKIVKYVKKLFNVQIHS